MPRGDTPADNAAKRAARQRAEQAGIPYTEALRQVRADNLTAGPATEEELAQQMLISLAAAGVPAELGEVDEAAVDIILHRTGWADGPLGEWDEVGLAWRAHAGWALVVARLQPRSSDRETYVFDLPRDASLVDTAAAVAAELRPRTDPAYLVWSAKHRAWWAPLHAGYVAEVGQAGRYAWDEAAKILAKGNIATPGDRPHQLVLAAPESAGADEPRPVCPRCGYLLRQGDGALTAAGDGTAVCCCPTCGAVSVTVVEEQFHAALRPASTADATRLSNAGHTDLAALILDAEPAPAPVPEPELAEREWATRARVRITRRYEGGAPDLYPRTRVFEPGQELEMVQWGRAGRPVTRDTWWTSYDIDGALIVSADHVEVIEVLHEDPPTWAAAAAAFALPVEQLVDLFGSAAAGWPDRGIIVFGNRQGEYEVRAVDGELLGIIDRSIHTDAPIQPLQYRAVVSNRSMYPSTVPMPAGFIPPSPARTADTERTRWKDMPGVDAPDTIRP